MLDFGLKLCNGLGYKLLFLMDHIKVNDVFLGFKSVTIITSCLNLNSVTHIFKTTGVKKKMIVKKVSKQINMLENNLMSILKNKNSKHLFL